MSNVKVVDNSSAVNDRVAKAKQLAAGVVNTPKDDVEAKAKLDLLKKAKMEHPYKPGKMISQMYMGEIFPPLGITLNDWLQASFVPVAQHQAALDELDALKEANKKSVAVTSKKK